MKKLLSCLCLFATICINQNAYSQACFPGDKTNLKSCVDSALEVCRDGYPSCNELEPALSIKDVRSIAISNCCGISKRPGRALCLTRERMKYNPSRANGPQRVFFRAARANISDIKRNICKNSSYTFPPDSSLF